MRRVLMYASVASMIQQFNMDNIRILLEQGYQVDVACNMEQGSTISAEKVAAMRQELEKMGVEVIHVPIPRSITKISQIYRSVQQTVRLMNDRNYQLMHCHSPIGGMVCRLANRMSKRYKTSRMIYTAHGFHFFKGAPLKNWLLFYPVEWLCAHWTDTLITINQEDYHLAQKKMHAGEVVYVPGVGVNLSKFNPGNTDKGHKRREFGIEEDSMVFLSVGELSARKNHEVILRALSTVLNRKFDYVICGQGALREKLEALAAELQLQDRVHLLGYRTDIAEILDAADVYAFPSLQEGLPVALMEAMACGKAVVCSSIRGNTDLIDEQGGMLFSPSSVEECRTALETILQADTAKMGDHNRKCVEKFSCETVAVYMSAIYGNKEGELHRA